MISGGKQCLRYYIRLRQGHSNSWILRAYDLVSSQMILSLGEARIVSVPDRFLLGLLLGFSGLY